MQNRKKDSTLVWKEDPSVAYKNFLQHTTEEVRQGVSYNHENKKILSTLFNSKEEKSDSNEVQVSAYSGDFYPLETALSMPIKCSKLTIINVEKGYFSFNFDPTIIPGIVGINAYDEDLNKQIKIAYRNIVPSEFSAAMQLAGPMGYHEYIIDGGDYKDNAVVSFAMNSNFKKTPIKIVIENCKGSFSVSGLSETETAKIFENKCKENVDLFQMPKFKFPHK